MGRFQPKAHFLDVHLANGGHHSTTLTTTTTTTTTTSAPIYSSYFAGAIKPEITHLRLSPPREESTRVQLQKQRLKEQQHAKQLVSTTIPGYKTSAAFFASLRTNLRLHASPPPSPISTPNSMRGSAASLPPPSPLAVPIMESEVPETTNDPLSGVPELKSYLATEERDRLDGLNLVADSVAQQRNAANRALIFHPLNMAVWVGVVGIVWRYLLSRGFDYIACGLVSVAIAMATLLGMRYLTEAYLGVAEKINWDWAGDVDVIITKFGNEVIGACIIEWVSGDSRKGKKKAWRGYIKGWTVILRYRHKGVGKALLEDAVKEAKKKGAESLEFADDHANSTRILPKMYNGAMDRNERKSIEMLADLCETSPVRGKRLK
ncbi:hypothetical protein M409DRAFT_66978 [Zasmidium cellare ATCC 36951]|uniref:N-acetyltransferase domain-containing protein n=1 Tax=Zasmidium cellare ATCC 36951 TaxID=1080233 RepID=A0A6A6CFU0_ZASCE|nr:uncharacterized protein M409DRAFT_66978 [Zasmidium cellare ATCC 36951]KAF2166107.1 hypothetical protein M409DRAFT_66978 [Zasmidium cellare ATCC 36951]